MFSKVPMSQEGVFNEADIAMMIHPGGKHSMVCANFLGATSINIEFNVKTAHAAADVIMELTP